MDLAFRHGAQAMRDADLYSIICRLISRGINPTWRATRSVCTSCSSYQWRRTLQKLRRDGKLPEGLRKAPVVHESHYRAPQSFLDQHEARVLAHINRIERGEDMPPRKHWRTELKTCLA
jgi:hypothetical protein